jgi:hypothetical protein
MASNAAAKVLSMVLPPFKLLKLYASRYDLRQWQPCLFRIGAFTNEQPEDKKRCQ